MARIEVELHKEDNFYAELSPSSYFELETDMGTVVNEGVSDHRELTGRDSPNQHPIEAVINLSGELSTLDDGVKDINTKIPEQASVSNKLADKSFVNLNIHSLIEDTISDGEIESL